MNTHADKAQENNDRAIAGNSSRQHSETASPSGLQQMINSSPQVNQLKNYQEMANNSPQTKQLKAYQKMADNNTQLKNNGVKTKPLQRKPASVQHNAQPVVQRVIDADYAYGIATHIVTQNPAIVSATLVAGSQAITDAVTFFGLTGAYTSTEPELNLIKQKIEARKAEVQAEAAAAAAKAAETARKAALKAFYAMNAVAARAHLNTLSAAEITALGARPVVFRSYMTRWGRGSEYMFQTPGKDPLAQFVVHVHWNNAAPYARSGVRFKPHNNKDRLIPGMAALDDAKAAALGIPANYGEKEMLALEK